MKSSFLAIGRALVALLVFLFLVQSRPAIAQGTCTCAWSGGFGCDAVGENNCDTAAGYVPQCAGGACQNNPQCTCVQSAAATCGMSGKPCCSGGICYDGTACLYGYCGAPSSPVGGKLEEVCEFVTDTTQKGQCISCFSQGKSWTAIGCISTNPTGSDGFITTLLRFGTGIAGGIAFFLILLGGFQILTSAGNPERLHAGQELVGSAVGGLLLIIFSLFLLRLIGFTILRIPGFG